MADTLLSGVTPAAVPLPGDNPRPERPTDPGFGDLLRRSIDAVNRSSAEANRLIDGLVSGEHANIHETMIAMEKAGLQMRLLTRAQNKVVDAYKEIMRMQL